MIAKSTNQNLSIASRLSLDLAQIIVESLSIKIYMYFIVF